MSKYRILLLATRHAVPPDSGYATDVYMRIEQLLNNDVDVKVILIDDGNGVRTDYPAEILAGCIRLSKTIRLMAIGRSFLKNRSYAICKWENSRVVNLAEKLFSYWPFDLIQAEGLFHMANAVAIRNRCKKPVILRSLNVEHAIIKKMANNKTLGINRFVWKREAFLLRKSEERWCRLADLCMPISEEDKMILQKIAPDTIMKTIQSGAPYEKPDIDIDPDYVSNWHFLHVGSLEWAPRLEGLSWFIRDVWPIARKIMPGARLSIAGSINTHTRARLNPNCQEGIEILGFVPQLNELARKCTSIVIPMRCGGGIKIRVLTAWANGWPIVGTFNMAEGLPAINEENCLLADDPSEFAKAMKRICCDHSLRQHLIRKGHQIYKEKYSWALIGQQVINAHLACIGK